LRAAHYREGGVERVLGLEIFRVEVGEQPEIDDADAARVHGDARDAVGGARAVAEAALRLWRRVGLWRAILDAEVAVMRRDRCAERGGEVGFVGDVVAACGGGGAHFGGDCLRALFVEVVFLDGGGDAFRNGARFGDLRRGCRGRKRGEHYGR